MQEWGHISDLSLDLAIYLPSDTTSLPPLPHLRRARAGCSNIDLILMYAAAEVHPSLSDPSRAEGEDKAKAP